jgi:hypothetical protein
MGGRRADVDLPPAALWAVVVHQERRPCCLDALADEKAVLLLKGHPDGAPEIDLLDVDVSLQDDLGLSFLERDFVLHTDLLTTQDRLAGTALTRAHRPEIERQPEPPHMAIARVIRPCRSQPVGTSHMAGAIGARRQLLVAEGGVDDVRMGVISWRTSSKPPG